MKKSTRKMSRLLFFLLGTVIGVVPALLGTSPVLGDDTDIYLNGNAATTDKPMITVFNKIDMLAKLNGDEENVINQI